MNRLSNTQEKKHIVIFSHGFGQKKDARGLFTDISKTLEENGIESVLFDYNEIDNVNNTATVPSFDKQVDILNKVIEDVSIKSPGSIIDIIGCSQGCFIVGLAKPTGIRKIVFIGPSLKTDVDKMIERFGSRIGSVVDRYGISKFVRRDNSLTIIPPEYWGSIEGINGVSLYNSLSKVADLSLIRANQDEVLSFTDITGIDNNINIINLDGNHDFTNEFRPGLLQAIIKIILN